MPAPTSRSAMVACGWTPWISFRLFLLARPSSGSPSSRPRISWARAFIPSGRSRSSFGGGAALRPSRCRRRKHRSALSAAAPPGGRTGRLLARWRARPSQHSRALWALFILLDRLPWPLGEDVLAALFMTRGLVGSKRRRAVLQWAAAHRAVHPWWLAAKSCAFVGRWLSRRRAIGFQHPDRLRENTVLEGREHLTRISGPAILLAFHVGPTDGDLTFRVLGYPVTFLGRSDRVSILPWWSEAWRPYVTPPPLSYVGGDPDKWSAVLYTARKILLDGGMVLILAEGHGREAFRLKLSVGELSIRAGWLTLHRLTGAPVLPVLRHLEGRRQVVTIHPPLPQVTPDSRDGLEEWRERLTRLVDDYVHRFPEQCTHFSLERRSITGPPD